MKGRILFIILLHSIVMLGQTNITIGMKAPEITITDWIANSIEDKVLEDKYIVLDFWATWCGHCITGFKELDSLKKDPISKDVLFLSITDERPEKVEKVIKRLQLGTKLSIVTDTTGNTQKRYGNGQKITSLPLLVLIDKKGIVQWKGFRLDKKTYYDFIQNKKIPYKEENNISFSSENLFKYLQNDTIVNFLKIRPSSFFSSSKTKDFRRSGLSKAKFIALNCDLKQCLITLLDYHPLHIEVSYSIKDLFDIVYVNNDSLCYQDVVEPKILEIYHAKKSTYKKVISAKKITLNNKRKLSLSKEREPSFTGLKNKILMCFGITIDEIIDKINHEQNNYFFAETKDTLRYDLELNFQSMETLLKSLKENGFKIKEKSIEVEFFKFEKDE